MSALPHACPRLSHAVAPSVSSEATTARGEQAGRRNPRAAAGAQRGVYRGRSTTLRRRRCSARRTEEATNCCAKPASAAGWRRPSSEQSNQATHRRHSRAELKNERQLSTPPKRREKGKYQTVILEQALARKEIYETVSAPSTPSFWKRSRRRPWTTSPRSTSPAARRRGEP